MFIPANARELTQTWLTDALTKNDTISETEVVSFEISSMGDGQGITAEMRRIHLHYDKVEIDAPATLIAKFPSSGEKEQETYFNITYHYPKEILFYQRIAPTVPITVPRCYYSDMNIDEKSFVLLIEDLAPTPSCDTVAGCDLATAELAIHEIALLHAQWWESPEIPDMTWMPQWDGIFFGVCEESIKTGWDPFIEKMQGSVPERFSNLRSKFAQQTRDIMKRNIEHPRTLTHFDFQPDNFFLNSRGELVVLDWQLTTFGKGAFDIAWLLGGGVDTALRREREKHLLDGYYHALLEGGVEGYSRVQLNDDYRLSLLHAISRLIVVVGDFGVSPEQEKRFCNAIAPRIISAILDSNAEELL